MTRNVLRLTFFIAATAVLLPVLADRGRAAEFRSGETVVVKADEVIEDDLYVFGEKVTIAGTVKGDVIAAAQQIEITGTIEGDLAGAVGFILVDGTLEDDARIAGQVLKFGDKATVGGDVVAAGLSLETEPGSTIEGDLIYGGFQLLAAGNVGQNVWGGMGRCTLLGEVGGDVEIEVGGTDEETPPAETYTRGMNLPENPPDVRPGFHVAESAHIAGDLKYKSPSEVHLDGTVAGKIVHTKPKTTVAKQPTMAEKATALVIDRVKRFASLLIVGLIAVFAFPRWTRRLSDNIRRRPVASFGLGIIGVVVVFILFFAILVAIGLFVAVVSLAQLQDLIGMVIVVGIVVFAAYVVWVILFFGYLAQVIMSLVVGRLIFGGVHSGVANSRVLPLVLGLVIFVLLASIPYASWFINVFAILFGLGAVCLWIFTTPIDQLTQKGVAVE